MKNVFVDGIAKDLQKDVYASKTFELIANNIHNRTLIGQLAHEYLEPASRYMYVTTETGERPFANKTNDRLNDNNFPSGVLSSIPLSTGYRIICISKLKDDYQLEVHAVRDTTPIKLTLELVYKGSTLGAYEPFLLQSIGEAIDKININPVLNWEQQINKFAFNPMRTIETRLFINKDPMKTSKLIGTGNDGFALELSNTAKEDILHQRGEVPIASICRIFYYKKYKRGESRFVSGVELDSLTVADIDEYLPTCDVDTSSIVNIHLVNGAEMLGIVLGSKIHVIYRHITGFKSVSLNEGERKFISQVEQLNL